MIKDSTGDFRDKTEINTSLKSITFVLQNNILFQPPPQKKALTPSHFRLVNNAILAKIVRQSVCELLINQMSDQVQTWWIDA